MTTKIKYKRTKKSNKELTDYKKTKEYKDAQWDRKLTYNHHTMKPVPGDKQINLNNINDIMVSKITNELEKDRNLVELQHASPIIWVTRNISTEKGEPMGFRDRPYLIDIYKDFSEHIVVKKGAQIGLTQLSVSKCLYVADNNHMAIIYTFPTATDVNIFSKTRFKPIISQSPYLRTRIREHDSQSLKEIGSSTIYFKGTFTEKQGQSIPSDLNIHDELDFSSPDVRDAFSARLSVSKYKWEWDFSTPTMKNFGIDALWNDSDKHVWIMKCPRCNKYQQISFFKNLRTRSKVGGKKRFYFGCKKCDRALDRRKGEWISLKPRKESRGYFVPQTICPVIDASYLVSEYKKAKKKPNGMKKFYNYNLGRPYESGENRISKELILSKVVKGTIEKGKIAIGADQGDILHVVVSKLTDRRRIIYINTLQSIPELVRLINAYSVENEVVCVLDAMPSHNEAKRFAEEIHNLYLIYYNDKGGLDSESLKSKLDEKEIHVSRTDLLDQTAFGWVHGESVIENYIDKRQIDKFADQMKNMKRDMVEDKRTKKDKAVWMKVGADHYRHADGYNYVASQLYTGRKSNLLFSTGSLSYEGSTERLFSASEIW